MGEGEFEFNHQKPRKIRNELQAPPKMAELPLTSL